MKTVGWVIIVIAVAILCISIKVNFYDAGYLYTKNYGQYLKLADDASTAQKKLEYLKEYRAAVVTIPQENAAYIFQQKRLTKTEQLKILDSLLDRLETTSSMKPESLEYQQAMYQITGQEFTHTLDEINDIFNSCYVRKDPMFFFWYGWGILASIFVGLIGVFFIWADDN